MTSSTNPTTTTSKLRVALLLTGEPRTIDKTWKVIKENIIDPNQACVFVQIEDRGWNPAILSKYWGDSVKSVNIMSPNQKKSYEEWFEYIWKWRPGVAEELFKHVNIDRQYLRNSGTVIEYYHLWKCAELMFKYEKKHGFLFDVIIRSRMDAIFIDPMPIRDFFNNNNGIDLINYCSQFGREEYEMAILRWFQGFGCSKLMPPSHPVMSPCITLLDTLRKHKDWDQSIKLCLERDDKNLSLIINEIIQDVPMLFSFRVNVIWFGLRKHLLPILPLIWHYGNYLEDENPFSWNAESQFRLHLKHYNVAHIDYHTKPEEDYFVSRNLNLSLLSGTELQRDVLDPHLVHAIIRPDNYPWFSV